jgi:hypothetical protein
MHYIDVSSRCFEATILISTFPRNLLVFIGKCLERKSLKAVSCDKVAIGGKSTMVWISGKKIFLLKYLLSLFFYVYTGHTVISIFVGSFGLFHWMSWKICVIQLHSRLLLSCNIILPNLKWLLVDFSLFKTITAIKSIYFC